MGGESNRARRPRVDWRAMAPPTPRQLKTRARFEALIRVMEPGLNLVLYLGERVARRLEREDPDYVPARPRGEPSLGSRRAVRLNTPPGAGPEHS